MTLESRVAKLERTNRRLMAALALAAGCLGLMAAKPPPKVVSAQQFVVRDADGNAVAAFGTELPTQKAGMTGIYFWKKDRTVAAEIDVNADGEPNLQLVGKGEASVNMMVTNRSGPFLQIEDQKGEVLFEKPTAKP